MGRHVRSHRDSDEVATIRETSRPARSIAQVIGLLAGFTLVVIGAIALITLLSNGFTSLTRPHGIAAGFHHTPLLAGLELLMGLILVSASAGAVGTDRASMTAMGALLLVAGIVIAVTWEQMHASLGTHLTHGLLYGGLGLLVLMASFLAPDVRERTSRREIVDEGYRDTDVV